MADAVLVTVVTFFVTVVTFFVTVVVMAVIVVGVSTSHLENCHCEIFRVNGVKFEDILAFLKMEDGDD